jgi:DNA-binding HxlR family transcriptional regulator
VEKQSTLAEGVMLAMTIKELPTKCPTDIGVQLLSSKWTIIIIRELMNGAKRPSDLEKQLKGISAKTLSERLHDLQCWGLVERQSHAEVPPRVEYSLTELGKQLDKPLQALKEYGQIWQTSMNAETYKGNRCKECPNPARTDICPSVGDLYAKKN